MRREPASSTADRRALQPAARVRPPRAGRRAPARFVRVERQVLLRLPVTPRGGLLDPHLHGPPRGARRPSSAARLEAVRPRRSLAGRAGVRVFVLTGAGVSAESGLGTFRDKGGIWDEFDPMQLATPEAFARDPERVHAFYNLRRRNLLAAKPNAAHAALARLAAWRRSVFLCTQNIDDLHEQAGSPQVHHMHGELLKARCGWCGRREECRGDLSVETICEGCWRTGAMRPDVVWFGEMPCGLDRDRGGAGRGGALRRHRHLRRGLSGGGLRRRGAGARHPDRRAQPRAFGHRPRLRRARYGPATEVVPAFVARAPGAVTMVLQRSLRPCYDAGMGDEARHDAWAAGQSYEAYMGRWSRQVAAAFLARLDASRRGGLGRGRLRHRGADGGGRGRLRAALAPGRRSVRGLPGGGAGGGARPAGALRARAGGGAAGGGRNGRRRGLGAGAQLRAGPRGGAARPAPGAAAGRAARLLRLGLSGRRLEFVDRFWKAAAEVDPQAADLDEARRFAFANRDAIAAECVAAGFQAVGVEPIAIDTVFADFADYWPPFTLGAGPAPGYCTSLDPRASGDAPRAARGAARRRTGRSRCAPAPGQRRDARRTEPSGGLSAPGEARQSE